ncbi:MAG: Unknown protein [uncultured Thiotrichaceae bacterium]|uniref:Roadblock/LAMTOR2 domain-containing protein n=1 Tax=uncultured Thiotrichaceae bacterium TaxID=298394 RepID=A0A6S6S3K8_9GAMM|nr:MAG: Unknown protein [uncultured Thiotrichaceae bacterium]
MDLNKELLHDIQKIPGISSISSIDEYGELLYSTEANADITSFISFVAGMNETLEEDIQLKLAKKTIIRGPKDNNLIIFNTQGSILAVQTTRKSPALGISKMLEFLLREHL